MEQSSEKIWSRVPPQTTMNELNDDVLRETFGHLNVDDLVIMADVCSTFRRVAQKEFSSRQKRVSLCSDVMVTANLEEDKRIGRIVKAKCNVKRGTLYVARPHWISVLRNFGNAITYLDNFVNIENHPQRPPLKAIVEYCSESLLGLYLYKTKWTNETISEWQPLLFRLRELTLHSYDFESDASRLLSFCVNLESLTITRFSLFFSVGRMSFDRPVVLPQLRSLNLYCSYLTNTDVEHLIVLNPQLKEIKLPTHFGLQKWSAHILYWIFRLWKGWRLSGLDAAACYTVLPYVDMANGRIEQIVKFKPLEEWSTFYWNICHCSKFAKAHSNIIIDDYDCHSF